MLKKLNNFWEKNKSLCNLLLVIFTLIYINFGLPFRVRRFETPITYWEMLY